MEFSIRGLNIEHFKINFIDGKSLSLNPPKLKVLRKAANIKRLCDAEDEEAVNEMIEVISLILSNNKEGARITPDFVEDAFDVADMQMFLLRFFEWVTSIKQGPNF